MQPGWDRYPDDEVSRSERETMRDYGRPGLSKRLLCLVGIGCLLMAFGIIVIALFLR